MSNHVVLENRLAVALVVRVKRQEATIEHLRQRLSDRDALLTQALQELAVYREEKDPAWFMYLRSTQGRSLSTAKRSAREKPPLAPERQGAA